MKIERIRGKFYPTDLVTLDSGVKREVVYATDAVAILLYNIEKKQIILVRQLRVPILLRGEVLGGCVTEVVAGRLDKPEKSFKEIAIEEAFEEAGVTISEEDIEVLNFGVPPASSSGMTTECCYLLYAEIKSGKLKHKKTYGLKNEGEQTTRICWPVEDLDKFPWYDMKTFALIQWFLAHKLKQ